MSSLRSRKRTFSEAVPSLAAAGDDDDSGDSPSSPPRKKKQPRVSRNQPLDDDDESVAVDEHDDDDEDDFEQPSSSSSSSQSRSMFGQTAQPTLTSSVQPKELYKAKDFSRLIKQLMDAQPTVAEVDVHPRNKDRFKAGGLARDLIGKTYNAHRMRMLSVKQLQDLQTKLVKAGWNVMPDGCWVAKGTVKQQGTFANPMQQGRPRGLQLAASLTKGYFKRKDTFELVQIQLYSNGVYPATSEDEVSHLCHNNFCVNPAHITWELHPSNVDRERCRHTRAVVCPSCTHLFNVCNHYPLCVPCTCVTSSTPVVIPVVAAASPSVAL
jgi:hypothetical protein